MIDDEPKPDLTRPIAKDDVLWDMLPPDLRYLAETGPAEFSRLYKEAAHYSIAIGRLNEELSDLRAALQKYADETGQGFLFFDNVRLCLEQVRENRRPTFLNKPAQRE